MSTTVLLRSSMHLFGLLLFGGCAATGPGYSEAIANAEPVPDDAVRIVFLRPRDRDDGSGGGAASIEVNQERVGALRYGGFLYADVASGTIDLTAFGRYRAFGACEIDITTTPGSTVFVDVGPRLSYMIAGAVGGAIGGVAGAAAVPDVYGSAGAAIATGTAGISAGSAAGATVGTTIEGKDKRCRGPYKLAVIAEEDALPRLTDLIWSND